MDIKYVAGLFDGEGCVMLEPYSGYSMRLVIASTHLPVLEMLKASYNGCICKFKQKIGRKPIWQWCIACKQAEEFLNKILPYLIIKKEEAEYALLFRKKFTKPKRYRKKGISEEEKIEREIGFKYLKSLR